MRIMSRLLLVFGLVISSAQLSLAGSPAIGRAPLVVDSTGRVLGSLGGDMVFNTNAFNVLRKEGSLIVGLSVARSGVRVQEISLYHTASDCSDAPYLPVGDELVRRTAQSFDQNTGIVLSVWFPDDPVQQLTIRATEYPNPPAACVANGDTPFGTNQCCSTYGPSGVNVGPAQKFDVSIYVPPFSLK